MPPEVDRRGTPRSDRRRRRATRLAAVAAVFCLGISAARAAVPAAPAGPGPTEPLAGISGDTAFLRSSNNLFIVFPSARLQIDGLFFTRQIPKSGFALRQVRLELAGWVGPAVYYDVAGDFGAPPPADPDPLAPNNLAATDAYIALAPWGDAAILQVGQFDAPFTLENRTSDKYLDFMDRSLTVRALGAPANKEVGVMLHGTDEQRFIYYSGGIFNGDGPNFRNVDNQFNLIGRAWIAPFALDRGSSLGRISVGGSFWSGRHLAGQPYATQTTAGGLRFLNPRWSIGRGDATTIVEMHQHGRMYAYAVELNAPLTPRLGLRAEYVYKHQQLAEDDIGAAAAGRLTILGNALVNGYAAYGDLWLWLIGDDRMLPAPGLQLPKRLTGVVDGIAPYGLMLALRGELMRQDVSSDTKTLANPNLATTRVMSFSAGLNYWYSRRFRFSTNYVVNIFGGTTENIKVLVATVPIEHEVLLRLAIAL
jgi:hypothetical protein